MGPLDEDMRLVLEDYHNLKSELAANPQAIVNDDKASRDQLTCQNTASQQSLAGIGKFLSSVMPTKFYNERRAPDSSTALKVLLTAELLEMVLEQATIFDMVNFCGLCQELKAIIDASSKLQRLMLSGTEHTAAQNQTFSQPHVLGKLWYIAINPYNKIGESSFGCMHVTLKRGGLKRDLPAVGETWKKMQICFPPIKFVTYCSNGVRDCCEPDISRVDEIELMGGKVISPYEADMVVVATTGGGLTLGELYDKANQLFKIHDSRDCRHKLMVDFWAYDPVAFLTCHQVRNVVSTASSS